VTCEGKDKGKKGAEPVPVPEPETLAEDGEPVEPPPKTYVIKERFEFFRPCIQVQGYMVFLWEFVPWVYYKWYDHAFSFAVYCFWKFRHTVEG